MSSPVEKKPDTQPDAAAPPPGKEATKPPLDTKEQAEQERAARAARAARRARLKALAEVTPPTAKAPEPAPPRRAEPAPAPAVPNPPAPAVPNPPAPTVPNPPPAAPSPGAARAHAAEVRRARSRKLLARLAVFVGVPTVTAGIYYGTVATPQFESYATFTVQSSEIRPTVGMEGLLAGITAGGGQDALAVRDYALSRDMLTLLDEKDGFIGHYQDKSRDWFSRLASDASFEDAYEYFGSKVYADYNQTSGAITLRVRAFAPDKAKAFADRVLTSSEEMVNRLSERQRRDRTRWAESELKLAEGRLQAARKALVEVQHKHKDFSPLQTAGAAIEIRTQLEAELAKARAELMQLKSYMNDNAPQVRAANEKVRALAAQAAGESRRLIDPKDKGGLTSSLLDFEAAASEKELAEKAYASSLAALELARADADRQHRYLAVVSGPSKPDESTYPHRIRSVVAAFVLSFLLLGVASLVGAAIREHARL